MEIGDKCNINTILRYIFGKLSDDANVRAGQNKTNKIKRADLEEKLTTWMQTQVGSEFKIKDV